MDVASGCLPPIASSNATTSCDLQTTVEQTFLARRLSSVTWLANRRKSSVLSSCSSSAARRVHLTIRPQNGAVAPSATGRDGAAAWPAMAATATNVQHLHRKMRRRSSQWMQADTAPHHHHQHHQHHLHHRRGGERTNSNAACPPIRASRNSWGVIRHATNFNLR